MVGLIESRTDEVCHTGIEDGKLFACSLLHIGYPTDEAAALSYYGASQLEVQGLSRQQAQVLVIGSKVICEIRNREVVGMMIVNAQSATYIDMFANDVVLHEQFLQFVHTVTKGHKVIHFKNLRTDVEVQPHELDILHLLCLFDDWYHIVHGDAELVFRQSCGDVGMGMCSNVRVDTESHMRHFSLGCSQFVDDLQFRHRFYIEAENIMFQAVVDFLVGFSHTGKYNLLVREARFDRCTYFAAAYTIGSQSCFSDYAKHFGIGIGLDGIVHHKIFVLACFTVDGVEGTAQHIEVVVIERSFQLLEVVYRVCSFNCHIH